MTLAFFPGWSAAELRTILTFVNDAKAWLGIGYDQTQSPMGRPLDHLEVGACA
jgi:hypothetical protein